MGQNGIHFRVGPGDHMDADQLPNLFRGGSAGIGGSLHSAYIASDHHGHKAAPYLLLAYQI